MFREGVVTSVWTQTHTMRFRSTSLVGIMPALSETYFVLFVFFFQNLQKSTNMFDNVFEKKYFKVFHFILQ